MTRTTPQIVGIGLATPAMDASQAALGRVAAGRHTADARKQQVVGALYQRSKIDRRGSVLLERGAEQSPGDAGGVTGDAFGAGTAGFERFYPEPGRIGIGPVAPSSEESAGCAQGPGTAERMARYQREALPLVERAADDALQDAGLQANDVDELVVVTCTGFESPGVDLGLIERLGLGRGVGRTQVGFMGCHGALSGLRVAAGLCEPGRAVLMCCVELCTLHFQYGWRPQQVVANALFADGAAACVVQHPADIQNDGPGTAAVTHEHLTLSARASHVIPSTAELMTWTIEDHGFAMTLDPKTPEAVAAVLPDWLDDWLASVGMTRGDVGGWAIHPGGPRLLETVGGALGLTSEWLAASRNVLRNHGNMSSGTVLFILEALRQAGTPRPWVAMAFGPGLTIEAALLV